MAAMFQANKDVLAEVSVQQDLDWAFDLGCRRALECSATEFEDLIENAHELLEKEEISPVSALRDEEDQKKERALQEIFSKIDPFTRQSFKLWCRFREGLVAGALQDFQSGNPENLQLVLKHYKLVGAKLFTADISFVSNVLGKVCASNDDSAEKIQQALVQVSGDENQKLLDEMLAVSAGCSAIYKDFCKALLEAGANPNAVTERGHPLVQAMVIPAAEVIRVLYQHGASFEGAWLHIKENPLGYQEDLVFTDTERLLYISELQEWYFKLTGKELVEPVVQPKPFVPGS